MKIPKNLREKAMEGVLSATDKQSMVSSFLEIAVGQTADTATQFLQVLINYLFFLIIKIASLALRD